MEVWEEIKDYEDYEVSNLGNVRRGSKTLTQSISCGVYKVTLSKHSRLKNKNVNRLVWVAFNGEIPDSMCITYKDGNKLNHALENLELITRRELALRWIKKTI